MLGKKFVADPMVDTYSIMWQIVRWFSISVNGVNFLDESSVPLCGYIMSVPCEGVLIIGECCPVFCSTSDLFHLRSLGSGIDRLDVLLANVRITVG